MQRLPELRRTPVRGRHPFVYCAAGLLLVALGAFIARVGAFWTLSTLGLAVLLGIGAIVIALRGR